MEKILEIVFKSKRLPLTI